MSKTIGIATDHAGKELKGLVAGFVEAKELKVVDYGVDAATEKSVDYPDYAEILAEDLSVGKLDAGILICGTGIGMSIVANKFAGVRAAVVNCEFSARMAAAHNNANVICLGSRTLNYYRATELVNIWLETKFEGSRHQQRLDKIDEIEKSNLLPRG